ncbi:hypothetical protein SDC9_172082 [bioreactor metagenome]|uniref:Uncharacterized protein n=1 Tax=bioreactor metagenome TaxID=1076179 RepID=A0A645GF07_9ZZZZ
MIIRQTHNGLRNMYFFGIGQYEFDDADNGRKRAALFVNAGAETRNVLDRERKVVVTFAQDSLHAATVRKAVNG